MASSWGTSWGASWLTSWGDSGVEPPVVEKKLGGGRAKKRRRLTVEIDGERFEVSSPAEARQLLLDARRAVQEVLREPVKKAVNGKLSIKKPEIKVIGDKGPELTEVIEAIADIRKEISAMYRDALKTMEIAHLMYLAEEEDEIMVLM